MYVRSLILVVGLATITYAIDTGLKINDTEVINEQKLNETENDPMDDKFTWEWLYDFVVNRPTSTTREPDLTEPEDCAPCSCGITNQQNRIVGGVETKINEYPWMALLTYRGRFYCGGTVINSRYVLTASHCVNRFQPNLMKVRILEHDQNSTSEAETQEFEVETVIKHSAYSTLNYNNDIALVKLKGSIKFEGKMRPVCLPERSKTFSGLEGIVTGWGATTESGQISQTLQEVTVPILSNAECRATKYPSRRITENMICAGYKEGSKDSCQGDSGGPLHIRNETKYHIVGVVSWGEGCAQPDYPGVYARVNRYLTWIKRNTADACYC